MENYTAYEKYIEMAAMHRCHVTQTTSVTK